MSARRFLTRILATQAAVRATRCRSCRSCWTATRCSGSACRDEVESRLVTRSGARWRVEHGPFTRRALARSRPQLDAAGERRRKYAAAARGLQSLFSFIPYARHDDVMVSYAAPGGGVGPHSTSYDVFLLQPRHAPLAAQRAGGPGAVKTRRSKRLRPFPRASAKSPGRAATALPAAAFCP